MERIMPSILRAHLLLAVAALSVALWWPAAQAQEPKALQLSGDYPTTHDPSIGREGNSYYVYATTMNADEGQFPIRCSNDLLAWKLCGQIFDKVPAWIHEASPTTKEL
jgi:arabinan endo-1,5-alpha-L-arabinosidase